MQVYSPAGDFGQFAAVHLQKSRPKKQPKKQPMAYKR